MVKHYDSYGNRKVYSSEEGRPAYYRAFVDTTIRTKENRYLLWIFYSPSGGTGLRRTFKTLKWAKRYAKRYEKAGFGVEVVDRQILPGDHGFLAGKTGWMYYMNDDGVLITDTFNGMQPIIKAMLERRAEQ